MMIFFSFPREVIPAITLNLLPRSGLVLKQSKFQDPPTPGMAKLKETNAHDFIFAIG